MVRVRKFDKEREAKALGLADAALLAWRKAHIAPLVAEFRRWLAIVHRRSCRRATSLRPRTP
jgi:hypothetical protein